MIAVSSSSKSSEKCGYKQPPKRAPGQLTLKSASQALAALSKFFVIENLIKLDAKTLNHLLVEEAKRLSDDRRAHLESMKRSYEENEAENRKMPDFVKCMMVADGLFYLPGIYKKKCFACPKVFYTLRPHGCYCSTSCRNAVRARKLLEQRQWKRRLLCCFCRNVFRAKRADAAFCSSRCRLKYFRAKDRAGKVA